MCARCEELEEELRQLRATLAPPAFEVPTRWGLTAAEAATFLALYQRRGKVASVFLLFEASKPWARNSDGPDARNVVSVRIHHIRKKLKAARAAYSIRTACGRGFYLENFVE